MSKAKTNTDKLRGLGDNGTVTVGNVNSEGATAGHVLTANGTGGATFEPVGITASVTSVNGLTGVVVLDKTHVGLGNVDNTSDLNKPISTATQTALDGKASSSHVHEGTAIKSTGAPSSSFLKSDGSGNAFWGSAPLTSAYNSVSDGVNPVAEANGDDILSFRSQDNKLSVTVGSNDLIWGDNVLFTVNEANLTLTNLGGTLSVAKGGTGATDASTARTNLGAASTGANSFSGTQDLNNNNLTEVKSILFNSEIDDGNSGAADTIDWSAGPLHKSTLTGNVTYTFAAPSGIGKLQIKLVQDGTGGKTVTWPSVTWVNSGGTAPTIRSAAGAITFVNFYYDGTTYYGLGSAG